MSKIGFIGSGNMAEAILGGILNAGIFKKEDILACDVNRERLSYINLKFSVKTSLNRASDIESCDILLLSVKPQSLSEVIKELGGAFKKETLFLSILAGVSTSKIENLLQSCGFENPKIIRAMPNLGALVNKSVSALYPNKSVSAEESKTAEKIFQSIGYTHWMPEDQMNLVTAVSGSGPAYVFYFMEAFAEAAEKLGMPAETASQFCLETLEGALELLKVQGLPAHELRAKVTSKAGTTEAALKIMEQQKVKEIFLNALTAANNRATELGQ